MQVWNYLHQTVTNIDEQNGKPFKGVSKTKKKKKHEEIEFHNLIHDWVFTTVYWLKGSAWKNAWDHN